MSRRSKRTSVWGSMETGTKGCVSSASLWKGFQFPAQFQVLRSQLLEALRGDRRRFGRRGLACPPGAGGGGDDHDRDGRGHGQSQARRRPAFLAGADAAQHVFSEAVGGVDAGQAFQVELVGHFDPPFQ